MPLVYHQMLCIVLNIPLGSAGMVAGAYLAFRLGISSSGDSNWDLVRWAVTIVISLGTGWICTLPLQWVYDRKVSARCPKCDQKTAYRMWPSFQKYQCRNCGETSTA